MKSLVSENELRQHEYLIRHPSDSRGILVSVFGARDFVRSVVYSHGFPASRFEAGLAHGAARDLGLTLIALDRPGFGGSDWYAGRTVADWADDVRLVVDHFGVRDFSILGVSGGTPTAVAAASILHERVRHLAIVSGIGPVTEPGSLEGMNWANALFIATATRCRWLGCGAVGVVAALWRTFPFVANLWFGALLPRVDLEIVERREVGVLLARNIQESLRQGVRGAISDFAILTSDWMPFVLQLRVPTTIWHGDADTYVPISMANVLHQRVPHSVFHKVKGGGHFMIVDRLDAILHSLA
jgi:pimeloyl-ACP methyl ester carboxylesterase